LAWRDDVDAAVPSPRAKPASDNPWCSEDAPRTERTDAPLAAAKASEDELPRGVLDGADGLVLLDLGLRRFALKGSEELIGEVRTWIKVTAEPIS